MAADIQEIILTIADLKLIRGLQVNLEKMDIHLSQHLEDLWLADKHIEQKLESSSKIAIAAPNVSPKQRISITDNLILSCNEELKQIQSKLESLRKCLDHQPIDPEKITECCETLLRCYRYLALKFNLLSGLLLPLKIINNEAELTLLLLDLNLLGNKIYQIRDSYAKKMDEQMDAQIDEFRISASEPVFSMDHGDFADSSSSSSSSGSSSLARSVDFDRGISNHERTEIYSMSFFMQEVTRKPLSTPSQNTAFPKEKKPQNAIHLLSKMRRKANDLLRNIELLCADYKMLHHGKENELYISVKQQLAKISTLINKLEKSLNTRANGHIRNYLDCFKYEKSIRSIVTEMRAIIHDPALNEKMKLIYESIRRNTVNRATKIQCQIRDGSEIAYTDYANRKEELDKLCNTIGANAGVVRQDIEKMKETFKEQIVDRKATDKQVLDSKETDKQIIDDGLVFGPIEIEPRTYSLKSANLCETKECSGNSQIFLPQKKTSAAEKPRRKQAAVESASREITPAAQFEPLIFTKESFKK